MSEAGSVRGLWAALAGCMALFLIVSGFRPDSLPFIPGAAYSDAALSHWPAAFYLRESVLDEGAFPLWRDGIMGGQPFAANPLNKTAYPLQWLALLLPPALHLDLMIIVHIGLAAWGMWRWARSLGHGPVAAAVSVAGYGLGTRLLAHTGAGHLDLLYALAWWSWLMDAARAAPGLPTALRLVLFGGLLVLADVRLALFALPLAGVYAVVSAVGAGAGRRLVRLWPVVPLGFAAIAGLGLPLVGWQPYLSRAGLTQADAGVFSLTLGHGLGLLGFPVDGGNPEQVTSVGLSLLVLALIGLVLRWRALRFWALVLAVAALYALGIHGVLWRLLTELVPGLLTFRVPSRAWLVWTLLVPLLAGSGVDMLLLALATGMPARTRQRGQLLALVGLVAAGTGGLFLLLALPALRLTGATLLVAAGLALVIWLGLARRIPSRLVGVLLLVIVMTEMTLNGLRWLHWRGPEVWTQVDTLTAETLIADGAVRVYAPYVTVGDAVLTLLAQPAAAAYDVTLFGGVDPFQLAGFVEAVQAATGIETAGYDVVQPPIQAAESVTLLDADLLAQWGVTHVVSPSAPAGWAQVSNKPIWRNPVAAGRLNAYGWPEGWPALPDTATIERLNGQTVGAWALSMATLAGCAAGLWLITLRARRGKKTS